MKVAKAKGRLRGKQPKLNRKQEAHLVSPVHSGEYSTAEVAELFSVGRSMVYRAIERQRVAVVPFPAPPRLWHCRPSRGSRGPPTTGFSGPVAQADVWRVGLEERRGTA
jgi:hypothetical protein